MWNEIINGIREAFRRFRCKMRCCCMIKSDCVSPDENNVNNGVKSIEL
jgi:hypothetical protein